MPGTFLQHIADFPVAIIDHDHRYGEVTAGWAACYSPGRDPAWWVGRDHVETFSLTEHPEWMRVYTQARAGSTGVHADMLDLPGVGTARPYLWLINPRSVRGVAVIVIPLVDVTEAAAATVRSAVQGA